MTTAILEMEEKQTIETEVSPLLDQARSITVRNQDQRSFASGLVKSMRELKDRIEERFHPTRNKETAYKTYQQTLETEKAFYNPIDLAVKSVTEAVKSFDRDEALRIQREAQAAEAKRLEEERKATEKLEAKAEKELAKGNVEKAEALLEQAESVTVAPSFTPPPQAAKKLIWKAKVTNIFALCKAIASGQVPFSVVEVRLSALNDFAKNYDGKTKIEGLDFYQDVNGRI